MSLDMLSNVQSTKQNEIEFSTFCSNLAGLDIEYDWRAIKKGS